MTECLDAPLRADPAGRARPDYTAIATLDAPSPSAALRSTLDFGPRSGEDDGRMEP